MKKIKILHIGILLFLFIAGCGLDSNTSIPPPTSGNCPNGQSLGCDDNCSLSPSEFDICGLCGGDGSSCDTLTINILYSSTTDIGGFQFYVSGVDVTGVDGGAAGAAGFSVSTGNNTVLGFSLQGATIPAGEGVLVVLDVAGDGDACLTDVILSDSAGSSIDKTVEDCTYIVEDGR